MVLRHAKSSWDQPDLDDFSRPLNERGIAAAFRIGEEMRKRGLHFDFALASSATRVRETLQRLSEGSGEAISAQFDDGLYMAGGATLLGLLRDLPRPAEDALIVGHNPGLQQLILLLSQPDAQGLRNRVAAKFPTAALAVVKLDADDWPDIAPGCGTIEQLILSRELA
jgi:phosphohistidine phosphatase